MRINELARRSGIPVATIKYYLRTGLLPAGQMTARNQADYDDSHLRRLRLVTALTDIGGMTVTATRAVLAAVDDATVPPAELFAMATAAGAPGPVRGVDEPSRHAVRRRIVAAVRGHGWRAHATATAVDRLTEVCAVAALLDIRELDAALDDYVDAALRMAECDLALVRALVAHAADPRGVQLREQIAAVAVIGAATHAILCGLAGEQAVSRLLARRPVAAGR